MSIDYAKAARQFRAQKAALTKAVNAKDPEQVIKAVTKAVAQWEEIGSWPDDWSRWQRALNDAFNWAWNDYQYGGAESPSAARFDIDTIRRNVLLGESS